MLKTNEINFLCSLKFQFTKLLKNENAVNINSENGTITIHDLISEFDNRITFYKANDTPLYLKDLDVVSINNNSISKITGGKYEYINHLNNILQDTIKKQELKSSNYGDFIYCVDFPSIQCIDDITENFETPTRGKCKYITKITFSVR